MYNPNGASGLECEDRVIPDRSMAVESSGGIYMALLSARTFKM